MTDPYVATLRRAQRAANVIDTPRGRIGLQRRADGTIVALPVPRKVDAKAIAAVIGLQYPLAYEHYTFPDDTLGKYIGPRPSDGAHRILIAEHATIETYWHEAVHALQCERDYALDHAAMCEAYFRSIGKTDTERFSSYERYVSCPVEVEARAVAEAIADTLPVFTRWRASETLTPVTS